MTISTEADIVAAMDNSVPKGLYAKLILVTEDGYEVFNDVLDDPMTECKF